MAGSVNSQILEAGPIVLHNVHRTRRFFPSSGCNHRQYSLYRVYVYHGEMARLGGLVKYEDGIPVNGHPSEY